MSSFGILKKNLFPLSVIYTIRNYSRAPPSLYKVDISEGKKEVTVADIYALLQKKDLRLKDIVGWNTPSDADIQRESQKFIKERHETLGPDLATANFILFRGGKIKFRGQDQWMDYYNFRFKEIPDTYHPGYMVEAIDASKMKLYYEGFCNFVYLRFLKTLLLKDCPHVDDFCLQRISHLAGSLEHLDVSGCPNVSERGLSCLYKMKRLKKLVIDSRNNIAHKELVSILLQDSIPQLEVDGVDFNDPGLHRRLRKYLE